MVFRLAPLVVSLVLASCGAGERPGLVYRVHTDPNFTIEQFDAIGAAVDDWRARVPGLAVDVTEWDCRSSGGGEICLHAATPAVLCALEGRPECDVNGRTYANRNGGDCYLDTSLGGAVFQYVVAHELGHAMGLLQHIPSGAVMSVGRPTFANVSLTVTEADVAEFWAVRDQ